MVRRPSSSGSVRPGAARAGARASSLVRPATRTRPSGAHCRAGSRGSLVCRARQRDPTSGPAPATSLHIDSKRFTHFSRPGHAVTGIRDRTGARSAYVSATSSCTPSSTTTRAWPRRSESVSLALRLRSGGLPSPHDPGENDEEEDGESDPEHDSRRVAARQSSSSTTELR
jgi:hypothetical protein